MKARRFLRYSGLALSILLAIWIVIIAAIYFLVDVNDVKKLAQKVVQENTKGELEIGEMRLKVFPMVYFEVDGLVFKASEKFNRETMFACKESKLSFNLFSLIFGKPSITLKLKSPDFNITSDGKTNSVTDVIITKEDSPKVDVSKYLFISRIMFKIKDADLKYTAPSKLYTSKGLGMDLEVDPVLRNIDLETIIPMTAKEETLKANGQVAISLSAHLSLDKTANVDLNIDATKLEIKTTSFQKPKGVEMALKAKMEADKNNNIVINDAVMTLAGKFLQIKGKVLDYKAENPEIDADISIKPSSIEKLAPLFTALKDSKVYGSMEANAKIKGNTAGAEVVFSLDATDVDLNGSSFTKPKGVPFKISLLGSTDMKSVDIKDLNIILVKELLSLKGIISGFEKPEIYFNIDAVTPTYDIRNLYKISPAIAKKGIAGTFNLKAKAQGSVSKPIIDMNLKYEDGKNNLSLSVLSGAKKPENITAKIYSSYVDLNKYLGDDKTPIDKKQKAKKGKSNDKTSTASSEASKNDPVVKKENIESIKKLIGKKTVNLSAKIDKVVFGEIDLSDFVLDSMVNEEAINISTISMNVIKSEIFAAFKMQLNEKRPAYSGKTGVKNLKATEAVDAFFPSLKGVVDGVLTSNMDFACSGYSINDMTKSLSGKGDFSFANFRYSAQNMNDLIQEKVGSNIQKLGVSANKITLKTNPGWEVVEGVFTIANEKINFEKFHGKDGEYEVNGKGFFTFDERMDMFLDFTVPYKNIPYEALKVEGKESSFLPVHLDGPAVKPRFDGPYTIKYLAERAFNYEKKKLEVAAKKEVENLKQKAQQEVQKMAEPIKSKLNDAIKKFKF